MLTRTRNKFTSDLVQYSDFQSEVICLVDDFEQDLEKRMVEVGAGLQVDDDPINHLAMKNALLHHFTCFLMQRNLAVDEVLDSRYVNLETAEAWFRQSQSPEDDSEESTNNNIAFELHDFAYRIDAIETENKRLKKQVAELEAKNSHLQQANIALEQQAIDAMRYRKSKRHHRSFESLDDYIQHELRTAIRDELSALGLSHV